MKADSRSTPPQRLTGVSLFSGCGGLDLGAQRAGVDVIYATDCMPEAADALAQLLPDTDFELADIRRLHGFPSADVLLGGYPCQPFSVGGPRSPSQDARAGLYREFARALGVVQPLYFVAENVVGMARRRPDGRRWLDEHLKLFSEVGPYGYELTCEIVNAADYGAPQRRRRIVIVGVRSDQGQRFEFPRPTHSIRPKQEVKPWQSHGDALAGMPLDPVGEYYALDEDRNWPWYYMSRNRKAPWAQPSFTILANARHATLHPASPSMEMVWSNLSDGWKQRWCFTENYEHLDGHPERPALAVPRRLSWRECAVLQTFPHYFEPSGSLAQKYHQVGNAVPPMLAEAIITALVDGSGLKPRS